VYDLVVVGADGKYVGIEVKSSLFGIFKLRTQQVNFGAQVYANKKGTYLLASPEQFVREVMYIGVNFGGQTDAVFKTNRLKNRLDELGVKTVVQLLPTIPPKN
jgi:hypothetical protein